MTALLLLTVLSFTTARAQDEGSGESEDTHEQQETTPEDEAPPRTPEPAHAAEEPVSEESDPADLAPENPAEESEQDDGTDEAVEQVVSPVRSFQGGGEPETEGGQAHLRGVTEAGSRQMMDLIEENEAISMTPVLDMEVGAVIGGGCHLPQIVGTAAHEADTGFAEMLAEQLVPLVHQVDGGGDHETGAAGSTDSHDAHLGLARTGGQNDDAPLAGGVPGIDGSGLVGTRLDGPRR